MLLGLPYFRKADLPRYIYVELRIHAPDLSSKISSVMRDNGGSYMIMCDLSFYQKKGRPVLEDEFRY